MTVSNIGAIRCPVISAGKPLTFLSNIGGKYKIYLFMKTLKRRSRKLHQLEGQKEYFEYYCTSTLTLPRDNFREANLGSSCMVVHKEWEKGKKVRKIKLFITKDSLIKSSLMFVICFYTFKIEMLFPSYLIMIG